MISFVKARTPVILTLSTTFEVQANTGECLRTLQELRRFVKIHPSEWVVQIPDVWVHIHKVYLPQAVPVLEDLAPLLWREIDHEEGLRLQDVFYDYIELVSSIPEHRAYQFFYVPKTKLIPVLRLFKRAKVKLKALSLSEVIEINFLPWRRRDRYRKRMRICVQVFLLPTLLLGGLIILDRCLEIRNQELWQQILGYQQRVLGRQAGPTLASVNSIFGLIEQLPLGVVLTAADFKAGKWLLSGAMTHLSCLLSLNELLTALHWLPAGASVAVYEEDQHYRWQLSQGLGPT